MTVSDPGAGQQQGREVCELSQRVDGKWHSWRFDGDDPYVICHYCGRVQDALTGRVMDEGRNAAPSSASHPSGLSPFPSPTSPARDSGREGCTCDAPLSSCTPGCPCTSCDALRDSGRDEAREAVARWLEREYGPRVDPLDSFPGLWTTDADELLALPELDKLLRRPA